MTFFLAGAGAALALLLAFRVPAGHRGSNMALSMTVTGSPALQLSRTGTVFDVGRLRRGRPLVTTLQLRDARQSALRVRTRAQVSGDGALARAVWTTIGVGGTRVFAGPLSRLTAPTARRFWLEPGPSTDVVVRLVVPRSAHQDLGGRYTAASLAFEVAP